MNNVHHKLAPRCRLLKLLALCAGTGLALLPGLGRAQVTFQVDRLNYAGGYVTVEFTDSRLLSDSTRAYALEFCPNLAQPNSWTNIYSPGATISSLSATRRMVTLPAPNTSGFYRVGVDTDRDGLSDGMEARLGTNPGVADSDGDGFSDLIEITSHTLPNNATNRPLRGVQPEVQFTAQTSQTIEGAGTIFIPIQFNTIYSGRLYYSLSVMSTATNGVDFLVAQPGVLDVNGTTAAIQVEILDDLEVEDIEAIVLELNDDDAGTYHTGAFSTHTILLNDNDANWSGLLTSNAGETTFRVRVLRSNAFTAALLVPSGKSTTNHQGGQIIPAPPSGQPGWPITNLLLTATQFTGESVPVTAGSSRLLGKVPLERKLYFSAVRPPPGDTNTFYLSKTNASLGPIVLGGHYGEALSPKSGTSSLRLTNSGVFVLSREAPVMPLLTIPTTPR